MKEQDMQLQIDAINQKLDLILEEIELQKRHRREIEDLKDDLVRVGKDVYQTALVELEEVHDHLDTGDILFLSKKILRNVKTLTKTFEQLESVKDFFEDFSPISRELAIDFMHKMDDFDRKGYFEFAKEMGKGVDNVISSFSVDDVKNLSDNIVTILTTIKNLTQPDMLQAINNAVGLYKNMNIEVDEKVSMISLLKELNTPEMKRGLSFSIKFLKSMALNAPEQNINKTVIDK